jgi:hypothetical protein
MGFFVAGLVGLDLQDKPRFLVFGIVELGKPIGNFTAPDEKLETISETRFCP